MTTEGQLAPEQQPAPASAAVEAARMRSTIEFPYFDLASAIEVAAAVKGVGGTEADMRQLAVMLNMAPDGGGFRSRVMTAKTFGLLDYDRGRVTLTELGMRIVDPQFERAARVESFLFVPLYKALFDRLNGQTLPPPPAVERMAQQLGVSPKQTDKARQAFMRSAKTAGLFELSSERLSLPPGGAVQREATRAADGKVERKGGGDDPPPPPGRLRFEVPIPGKPSAVVMVPDDLDADDWTMLSAMMTTYIERWKKFKQ